MPHQQPGRLPDGMADCLCSPAAKGGPSANWKQNTSAPFLHRWPGGPCRWHTPRPCFGLTAKCWATKGLQQREGCRTAPAPDQAPAPVACCQVAHTHDDGRAALRQAQRCFIAQAAVGARDHYHLAMWRCVCVGGGGWTKAAGQDDGGEHAAAKALGPGGPAHASTSSSPATCKTRT